MSLTDAQKTAIKRHLGYHSVSQSFFPLIEGFASIDTILSDLDATPETVTEAIAILTRLTNLEAQLDTNTSNLGYGQVEDVSFRGGAGMTDVWTEIKRWRRELSILIGIPMHRPGASFTVV